MSVRVDVVARIVGGCLVVALCVPMSGCKKDAATEAPNMDEAGEAKGAGDSADPIAELAALEGRMRSLGLPVAADKRATAEGEEADVAADASGGGEARTEPEPELVEEAPAPAPSAQVDATEPGSNRDETINYCGDLCSLSESICMLEVRICSLAEAHANDTIYADACERAVEDCEVAGEACDSCG
jgi:hypothetical protein